MQKNEKCFRKQLKIFKKFIPSYIHRYKKCHWQPPNKRRPLFGTCQLLIVNC